MRARTMKVVTRPLSYTAGLLILMIFAATTAMAGGSVNVTVDISPELKGQTTPEQVVFVFAKATRGPRAPLAAVKIRVADLPISVTLDDSKAVAPMFRLSNFDEVIISARISKSGAAMKQSGDLEGFSSSIRTDGATKPVHLVIDRVVK